MRPYFGSLNDSATTREYPSKNRCNNWNFNDKFWTRCNKRALRRSSQGQNSGGGHGTRRSQKRTNVEKPRRKSAVHVCTRDCTQIYKCYHPISASHLTVFCSRSLLSFCSFLPSFSSPLISPSSMYRILSHMEAILLSCVTISIVVPSLLIFRNDSITSVAGESP